MLSGWKLGAPRPDEMFYTLYDRARALESQEKQNSSNWTESLMEIVNRCLLERSRRVAPKAILVKGI